MHYWRGSSQPGDRSGSPASGRAMEAFWICTCGSAIQIVSITTSLTSRRTRWLFGSEYDGWPQPRDFYLARAAIPSSTSWTIAEYNTVNPGSMPPAGSTDEAMEPETMPAADEAMPAVGVAMETSGLGSGEAPGVVFSRQVMFS